MNKTNQQELAKKAYSSGFEYENSTVAVLSVSLPLYRMPWRYATKEVMLCLKRQLPWKVELGVRGTGTAGLIREA